MNGIFGNPGHLGYIGPGQRNRGGIFGYDVSYGDEITKKEIIGELNRISLDIATIKLDIKNIHEKLEEIVNLITYMPGGPGFKEAEKDFNERLSEHSKK